MSNDAYTPDAHAPGSVVKLRTGQTSSNGKPRRFRSTQLSAKTSSASCRLLVMPLDNDWITSLLLAKQSRPPRPHCASRLWLSRRKSTSSSAQPRSPLRALRALTKFARISTTHSSWPTRGACLLTRAGTCRWMPPRWRVSARPERISSISSTWSTPHRSVSTQPSDEPRNSSSLSRRKYPRWTREPTTTTFTTLLPRRCVPRCHPPEPRHRKSRPGGIPCRKRISSG